MHIYLDESGDLGWKFDAPYRTGGSSRHLTIASLLISTTHKHLTKRLIQKLYKKFNWPTSVEKKWAHMNQQEKLYFAQNAHDLRATHPQDIKYFSITVSKVRVKQELRNDPNILYNYMIGLSLLDEMSQRGKVTFIPDPRSIKVERGNSLHDYLQTQLLCHLNANTVLSTQPCDSATNRNVQFSDMLSGIVQSHFEDSFSDPWNVLNSSISTKTLFFPQNANWS